MKKGSLNELVKKVNNESESLKGHGQLDGLHNIARQNTYLAEINVELILAIKSLHNWTIALTVALIFLTCVLIIIASIPYLTSVLDFILHIS